MAVKEANSNYKSFTFNGISAADYGVYVTDVNVFNSAERAVEYITIPGRNGSFALDHGRFENITVEYECALGQDTDVDFATAISDFRNALAAAKGYQRLEDDMNPDEYRMAVFSKGLEAPTLNQQTATFKVEFNCKPQRYLKSGETAVTVAPNATITNPTLFDASPLLEVYGYGDITFGESGTVHIADDVIVGDVVLSNGARQSVISRPFDENVGYRDGYINAGDIITLAPTTINARFSVSSTIQSVQISYTGQSGVIEATATTPSAKSVNVLISCPERTFTAGTSEEVTATAFVTVTTSGGSVSVKFPVTFSYNADSRLIRRYIQPMEATAGTITRNQAELTAGEITAYSTAVAYAEPLYFDLDIGEAYAIEDGEPFSINGAVSFGVDLPVLVPGANTISLSNTIEELRIIPRWWEV